MKFAINAGTEVITVASRLEHQTASSYILTAQAGDGWGGEAMAVVAVAVTSSLCSNGTVLPNSDDNPNLVADCSALLACQGRVGGYGLSRMER